MIMCKYCGKLLSSSFEVCKDCQACLEKLDKKFKLLKNLEKIDKSLEELDKVLERMSYDS